MSNILDKILKNLENSTHKTKNIIKNLCTTAAEIKEKEKKSFDTETNFYGKNTKLIINNHIIKDTFMYFGENSSLNIAINNKIKPENLRTFYYYDTLTKTFFDFDATEKEAFLNWLEFFKYDEELKEKTPPTFLCLYFRNLQHRAIVDEKNLNDILFESIKFLNFYADNSYYYFKDNMIDLIAYLIFKIDNFTEEEKNILINFIKNNCNKYKKIQQLYDSFIIKIHNLNPNDYLNNKYENLNDKNQFIEFIYNYIKNTDFYNSKSKFYDFRPIFLSKTFKKNILMLTIFKKFLLDNQIDLKKNFSISYRKITSKYINYFLDYNDEKNFNYYAIEYDVGLQIRKILYKSYEIIHKYEEDKKEFLKEKRKTTLTDKEKFLLLPEIIQKEITGFKKDNSIKNPNNNITKIDFNIDFTKLNTIQNDTKDIQNTLTDIFINEDENEEKIEIKTIFQTKTNDIDVKYVKFVEFLKQKNTWQKYELMEYCTENKLMLNNAISIINEYYDDIYNDYLIEEDDNLYYINNI